MSMGLRPQVRSHISGAEGVQMDIKTAMMHKRLLDLLRLTDYKEITALDWPRERQCVLVLSPHYDDDILGCGGVLSRHCLRGDNVTVLFMTGGTVPAAEKANTLVAVRKKEAEKALSRLGANIEIIHFEGIDGNLKIIDGMVQELRRLLLEKKFDRIYFPNSKDIHPDHRTTDKLLALAMSGTGLQTELVMYEFWTPLKRGNRYFDLENVEEQKLTALKEHESQIAEYDYVKLVQTLNRERGAHLGCESCEVFRVLTREDGEGYCESQFDSARL